MSVRFGTGGWRAVIGDGFTRANIRLLCTALAQQLQADGKAQQGFVIDRRHLLRGVQRIAERQHHPRH